MFSDNPCDFGRSPAFAYVNHVDREHLAFRPNPPFRRCAVVLAVSHVRQTFAPSPGRSKTPLMAPPRSKRARPRTYTFNTGGTDSDEDEDEDDVQSQSMASTLRHTTTFISPSKLHNFKRRRNRLEVEDEEDGTDVPRVPLPSVRFARNDTFQYNDGIDDFDDGNHYDPETEDEEHPPAHPDSDDDGDEPSAFVPLGEDGDSDDEDDSPNISIIDIADYVAQKGTGKPSRVRLHSFSCY